MYLPRARNGASSVLASCQKWFVSLKARLVINKIYKVCKESYEPPPKPSSQEGPLKAEALNAYQEYEEANDRALAAIHITCGTTPFNHIRSKKTAKAALIELETRYGQKIEATIDKEFSELIQMRSSDFATLNEYLSHFRAHIEKLEEMGERMTDGLKASMFKMGLSEDLKPYTFTIFENFIQQNSIQGFMKTLLGK